MKRNKGWKWEVGTGVGQSEKDLEDYFEDLYNIDTKEEITVHMCGFDGIQRGNYFGGEPIGGAEVEVRGGKLKNGKATRR